MLCAGVIILGIGPAVNTSCLVTGVDGTLAVIKPEGNVQPRDFFQPILALEVLRKQRLPLAEFQKGCLDIFLAFLEGKDSVGLQATGQPSRQDRRIAAEGAEGRCRVAVGNEFAAAGGTQEHTDVVRVGPVFMLLSLPLELVLPGLLAFLQSLDGLNGKFVVAEGTGQLLGIFMENEPAAAAGTFIFQNIGHAVSLLSL